MQVLHIDDSPEIAQLYSDFLGIQNHNVESVNNGHEGLELAIKNDYDMILLDLLMPEYCGMQFLDDLKNKRPSELKKVTIVTQLELNMMDHDKIMSFGINSIQEKTIDLINFENTGELEVKDIVVAS